MEQLSEPSISPYKVKSYEKAMTQLSIPENTADIASNTNATVSLLNDIKGQNVTIISNQNNIKTLLQQLVDK